MSSESNVIQLRRRCPTCGRLVPVGQIVRGPRGGERCKGCISRNRPAASPRPAIIQPPPWRVRKRDAARLHGPAHESERPIVRAECVDGPRPCPFVSCRHHLYLDVTDKGSIKATFPHLEPEQIPETCSLDVADQGGATLEEVGAIMNVTRERVRQMEAVAVRKVHQRMRALGYRDGLVGDPEGSPLSEIRLMAGMSADDESEVGS